MQQIKNRVTGGLVFWLTKSATAGITDICQHRLMNCSSNAQTSRMRCATDAGCVKFPDCKSKQQTQSEFDNKLTSICTFRKPFQCCSKDDRHRIQVSCQHIFINSWLREASAKAYKCQTGPLKPYKNSLNIGFCALFASLICMLKSVVPCAVMQLTARMVPMPP